MHAINKLVTITCFLTITSSFAYSGYWYVTNHSLTNVYIARTLAGHGDFHCSTANKELNKNCIVEPNQNATIHLTTTSSLIHEDFDIQPEGVSPGIFGVHVSYECGLPNAPTLCTDGGPHTFETKSLPEGNRFDNTYFLVDPESSQTIMVIGR